MICASNGISACTRQSPMCGQGEGLPSDSPMCGQGEGLPSDSPMCGQGEGMLGIAQFLTCSASSWGVN